MPSDCISYQDSGYFSTLIVDYLNEKKELKALYNRFPSIENFEQQILEKQDNFSLAARNILFSELKKQYTNFKISDKTEENISLLKEKNTFTITTGHQLNLFSGPLYFLYKIFSTINLCNQLQEKYPKYNFVPVYWMATEDHDFEEINHFQVNGKNISWNKESNGPVGRLSTSDLDSVFEEFSKEIGIGKNAEILKKLFQNSYLNHKNLADATRFLANELFRENGLVIVDGDSFELKKLFIPFAKKELLDQQSTEMIEKSKEILQDYFIQVNPREINLFYIEDNLRERIVFENNSFKINNTDISFSKEEILSELNASPEKFSPNVILRPLYQEVILPNLCYIGGGGELAYWFELKENFANNNIVFPILLLRNSVLIATKKQTEKADKLDLSWKDLFQDQQALFEQKTKENSKFEINFTSQKSHLKEQFKALYLIAEQTDKSFVGAVAAQEKKQLKGLDNLEKRLLKAEKRKYAEVMQRTFELQNKLFPNTNLQERKENFSSFFLKDGKNLLQQLQLNLNPLSTNFTIITL